MKGLHLIVAAAAVIAGWLTLQLGQLWWVFLVLLAIDALLHWQDELAWWPRVAAQLLSLAAAAYLAHGFGLVAVRTALDGLVAWQLVKVSDGLRAVVAMWRKSGLLTAAEAAAVSKALAAVQADVKRLSGGG